MKIIAVVLLILCVCAINANAARDCGMSLLEKFFILPEEKQILTIQTADGPCKLANEPIPLSVVQAAKKAVDENSTVTNSKDAIVYAKELRHVIAEKTGRNETTVDMWNVDYPAQTPIVSQNGLPIDAGQATAMLIKDRIAIKGKLIYVTKVENINPPWLGIEPPFDIECNGALNYSNTDEIVQTLFKGKVNSITPIA